MESTYSKKGSIDRSVFYERGGRVLDATGAIVSASGCYSIGSVCSVSRHNDDPVLAEVVGFREGKSLLTPFGPLTGISHQSLITQVSSTFEVPVSNSMMGRVLNGLGQPIDGRPAYGIDCLYPCHALPPDPMSRPIITEAFALGVRAIDGLLTCGLGQRLGLFAAAGGGKSSLLSMIIRNAVCDVVIVSLIGERGREVLEFVENLQKSDGVQNSVTIVATSDRPAAEQVNAAYTATAIAEYFRDQGKSVLLLMDSITRFARAQRQIGLAAGEPPTRRGFPPSVFEKLPLLVERSGRASSGSITSIYTVLVEGDDMAEPVADEVRSLLDGHIVLSQKLASKGHYPAIDVLSSSSRVFSKVATKEQVIAANNLRELISKYDEVELLVQIGEYQSGADSKADKAIKMMPAINAFLRQSLLDCADFDETMRTLTKVGGDGKN
ncbi:FliI/YscN family ATPase [Ruegeria sp. SCPT10]|uniref:FliI/YscN family ATPase n=1 Tax=Ruegeria sp. SCP10 TaxID=3141377 RepID=UPI003335479D